MKSPLVQVEASKPNSVTKMTIYGAAAFDERG